MAMNNEPDTSPDRVPVSEEGELSPEVLEFIAEVTRDEVRGRLTPSASGFNANLNRPETESQATQRKPFWRQGLEEFGIAVGAAVGARVVDPSIIVGGLYAALQFGRTIHGYRRNPLQTLLSQQQAVPRNSLVIEAKVFETDERSGRMLGTLAKGLVVAGYSMYLSLGAPAIGSAEGESSTPVNTEVPPTSEVPTSTTADTLSPYSTDCQILLTPIPLATDSKLSVEQKDDYELSVKRYQELLRGLNLYRFNVDGVAGEQTQTATRQLKQIIVETEKIEGIDVASGTLTTQECMILLESGIWERLIALYEDQTRN